jgi:hypothetical protein
MSTLRYIYSYDVTAVPSATNILTHGLPLPHYSYLQFTLTQSTVIHKITRLYFLGIVLR